MMPGVVYNWRADSGRCQVMSPSHSTIPVEEVFAMAVLVGVVREAQVRPC